MRKKRFHYYTCNLKAKPYRGINKSQEQTKTKVVVVVLHAWHAAAAKMVNDRNLCAVQRLVAEMKAERERLGMVHWPVDRA